MDAVAIELRREVRNRLEKIERKQGEDAHYVERGLRLIRDFMKGTFIARLKEERIRYIVKVKGEDVSLSQLVETALQEESGVVTKICSPQSNNWSQDYVRKEFKTEGPKQIKIGVNLTANFQCYRCSERGQLAKKL